jgi:hypothetical protein
LRRGWRPNAAVWGTPVAAAAGVGGGN